MATSFTFRLYRLGPEVLAGLLFWPGATGFEVGRAYRDLMSTAPDELGAGLVFLTGPAEEFMPAHLQGTTVAAVAVLWAGEVVDGEEAIAPLPRPGTPGRLRLPTPYTDFQCIIDDPPGQRNYWSADYHDDFPDDALDVFVKYGFDRPSPLGQQPLPLGWGLARVADAATPMANRSVRWVSHPFAVWEDEADDAANIDWARGFRRDIGNYATGGVYLNFIGNEGQDRIRAAFGDAKYERLARLKAEWDPDNRFRATRTSAPRLDGEGGPGCTVIVHRPAPPEVAGTPARRPCSPVRPKLGW